MSKCSELMTRTFEKISIVYMAIIFILIAYYEQNVITSLLAALAVIAYALTFLIKSQANQQTNLITCSIICLMFSGEWITKIELMGLIYSVQATKLQKQGILPSLTTLCLMEFLLLYIWICDQTRNLPCMIIPSIQLVLQSLCVLWDIKEMRKIEDQQYSVTSHTSQTFTQRSQTLVSTLEKHLRDKCPYLVAQIKPLVDGSGFLLQEANNNFSQYLIQKSLDLNDLLQKLDLKVNGRKSSSLYAYIMSRSHYILNEVSLSEVKVQQFQSANSTSRINLLKFIKDANNNTAISQKALSILDETKNKLRTLNSNPNDIISEQILCLFRGDNILEAHYITLIWECQSLYIWIDVLPVDDNAERYIKIQRELYKLPYIDDSFKEIGFLEDFILNQVKKTKKIYKLASAHKKLTTDSLVKNREQAITKIQGFI